jgi:hypothetical protein
MAHSPQYDNYSRHSTGTNAERATLSTNRYRRDIRRHDGRRHGAVVESMLPHRTFVTLASRRWNTHLQNRYCRHRSRIFVRRSDP